MASLADQFPYTSHTVKRLWSQNYPNVDALVEEANATVEFLRTQAQLDSSPMQIIANFFVDDLQNEDSFVNISTWFEIYLQMQTPESLANELIMFRN